MCFSNYRDSCRLISKYVHISKYTCGIRILYIPKAKQKVHAPCN